VLLQSRGAPPTAPAPVVRAFAAGATPPQGLEVLPLVVQGIDAATLRHAPQPAGAGVGGVTPPAPPVHSASVAARSAPGAERPRDLHNNGDGGAAAMRPPPLAGAAAVADAAAQLSDPFLDLGAAGQLGLLRRLRQHRMDVATLRSSGVV
jgi:hypothetical protein